MLAPQFASLLGLLSLRHATPTDFTAGRIRLIIAGCVSDVP